MTNGIPVIDPTNLTMEKLQAAIDELKAQNPRAHAEMMLLASVRRLSIGSLERLADMANRKLFDSLNMFDEERLQGKEADRT
jgi:hypothetical protein